MPTIEEPVTTPTSTTSTSQPGETRFATSADGTRIAYEVSGSGPALVLVDGALCARDMGHARPLAAALAASFTVHAYDRRGRGESGSGESAYHPDREIEDLAAVIEVAGGHAHVFGASSGAALALDAASHGLPIDGLVMYEAPFIVDDTHAPNDLDLGQRTGRMVAEGRHGDAVRLFMRTVGLPGPMISVMRLLPVWRKLTAVAPTLPHDYEIVLGRQQGEPLPAGVYDAVSAPTLVIAGGKSPEYLRNSQAAIAAAVPTGRLEILAGQTHMVKPKATAPVVAAHLLAIRTGPAQD
jgi:pimeloyl-ACP methyl ester carboxylesterase